ncbi:MBL fold metallo-hydrolase [Acrasis kona]|uniref:MBL fold metallo-hydrolase n=1 Tax=Acrasis kona TaxID=1008807 RepID=A0AAW2YIW4_9EUKA
MPPAQVNKIKINDLTFQGYSRAGDATGFYVPELGICLDAGIIMDMKPSAMFITHSHSDHSFMVPYFYGRRGTKLPIYTPGASVEFYRTYLQGAQNLNDCDLNAPTKFELRPVEYGDTFEYAGKRTVTVEVIRCFHPVPCVGYLFYEKRNRLKEEYKGLTGKEIAELRKNNVQINESVVIPLFAFLGDSTPEVFEQNKDNLKKFPLIICECTFLTGQQESSKGHTYWSGLKPHVENMKDTTFMLIHFSSALKKSEIEDFFKNENIPNVTPFLEK